MSHLSTRLRRGAAVLAALVLTGSMAIGASAASDAVARYLVVFDGTYALDGSYALGGDYALNHQYALSIVEAAGGSVTNDLSKQIGVMIVEASNANFYALLSSYALVAEVGRDWGWVGLPTYALADVQGDNPDASSDALEIPPVGHADDPDRAGSREAGGAAGGPGRRA